MGLLVFYNVFYPSSLNSTPYLYSYPASSKILYLFFFILLISSVYIKFVLNIVYQVYYFFRYS